MSLKNDCIFSAGENALLSCATDAAIAGLSATWLKDNKPLDDKLADRVKIVAKENHFTLELQNASPADSGQYTVRLSGNDGQNVACSAHLEVHKRKFSLRHSPRE